MCFLTFSAFPVNFSLFLRLIQVTSIPVRPVWHVHDMVRLDNNQLGTDLSVGCASSKRRDRPQRPQLSLSSRSLQTLRPQRALDRH